MVKLARRKKQKAAETTEAASLTKERPVPQSGKKRKLKAAEVTEAVSLTKRGPSRSSGKKRKFKAAEVTEAMSLTKGGLAGRSGKKRKVKAAEVTETVSLTQGGTAHSPQQDVRDTLSVEAFRTEHGIQIMPWTGSMQKKKTTSFWWRGSYCPACAKLRGGHDRIWIFADC